MSHRFQKHYTREEARALLPQVREWLARLNELRREMERDEKRLNGMFTDGQDLGGNLVNDWVRTLAALQSVLAEFQRREIQLKDVERGLLDFPAIIGGREVFLCWEDGEEDIEHWHELDTGYGGRERLE
ncbi:MAG: DUF2203 family protein [Verrucomicrobia bacterium]|nr:MAG: DUF2203 family protein [Verrucomicrobiota bacterium]